MRLALLIAAIVFIAFTSTAQQICFEEFREKIADPNWKQLRATEDEQVRDSLQRKRWRFFDMLIGCQMPYFAGQLMNQEKITSDDLKGKIVVMNFWYIGCKPCVAEMPALNRLVEAYKDKDVVFLSFAASGRGDIENFLQKREMDFLIIPGANELAKPFMPTGGYPTNLVFDQSGSLVFGGEGGYVDERAKTAIYDELSPIIDDLLAD